MDLESDLVPLVQKSKGKSNNITATFKGIGQRVEVRYNDGLGPGNEARYKGTFHVAITEMRLEDDVRVTWEDMGIMHVNYRWS